MSILNSVAWWCRKHGYPPDVVDDALGEARLALWEFKGDRKAMWRAVDRFLKREARYAKRFLPRGDMGIWVPERPSDGDISILDTDGGDVF